MPDWGSDEKAGRGLYEALALVFILYLGLTAMYAKLGYLRHADDRIRGIDTVYYYIYLRSAFIDHDLDFRNELDHYYGEGGTFVPDTGEGMEGNMWAVGPAVFWSPFYALAQAVTMATGGVADGYSSYYQLSAYVGNSLYGLLGVMLSVLFASNYVKGRWALILTGAMVTLCTQMTYYVWPFYPESHNVSLVFSSLFLYLWVTRGMAKSTALAAGLMVLSRWQTAILLLPYVAASIRDFVAIAATRDYGRSRIWTPRQFYFIMIMVIAFLPQILAWYMIYDVPLVVPQGGWYFDFMDLPVLMTMFSTNHGLFMWHPVLLVGMAGLAPLYRRDRLLAICFLLMFTMQLILNSAVYDWWAFWSFGHRRFIELTPVFALGFGLVIDRMGRRGLSVALAAVLALAVWNQMFIYQYQRGLIPRTEALSMKEMVWDKFRPHRVMRAARALDSGLASLLGGDARGFRDSMREAYETDPHHRDVALYYAFAVLLDGRDADAAGAFDIHEASAPDDPLLIVGRLHLLALKGEHDRALGVLRANESLFKDAPALYENASMLLGLNARTLVSDIYVEHFLNRIRKRDQYYGAGVWSVRFQGG